MPLVVEQRVEAAVRLLLAEGAAELAQAREPEVAVAKPSAAQLITAWTARRISRRRRDRTVYLPAQSMARSLTISA
jgi:hypothetical protein